MHLQLLARSNYDCRSLWDPESGSQTSWWLSYSRLLQESVGSGIQQAQGRTPPTACLSSRSSSNLGASQSRYSSNSSLGSSRNGEDVICTLNLRQMIEQGIKLVFVSLLFQPSKRPLMGFQLTSRHVFETAEKCSCPVWAEKKSKVLPCMPPHESGLAGWMRFVKKGAGRLCIITRRPTQCKTWFTSS